MIRWLLGLLGIEIYYRSAWGEKTSRYDGLDYHVGRPIHPHMGVAPPWATRHYRRKS